MAMRVDIMSVRVVQGGEVDLMAAIGERRDENYLRKILAALNFCDYPLARRRGIVI